MADHSDTATRPTLHHHISIVCFTLSTAFTLFLVAAHSISSLSSSLKLHRRLRGASRSKRRHFLLRHYLAMSLCLLAMCMYCAPSLAALLSELHVPRCLCAVLPAVMNNGYASAKTVNYLFLIQRAEGAQGSLNIFPARCLMFGAVLPCSLLLSWALLLLLTNAGDAWFTPWRGLCVGAEAVAGK